MSETALNFGPDWIRALATGSTSSPCPPSMTVPRYSLAEFRYGREEMLALIPKEVKVPSCLQNFPHLVREKFQVPLALTPITEDEQRLAARSVNSDAALRASGKTGYGMSRPGRGGSVDRGRGRGRGGYYQRGLMHEDTEEGQPFSRPRTLERSSSVTEKDQRWDERDRLYARPFSSVRGDYDDTNLKHDNIRGPNEQWRKFDKEDEGGWRTAGSRSFDKLGGKNSWRTNTDRKDLPERTAQTRNSIEDTKGGIGPQHKQGNSPATWRDGQANLPEWSVEETVEPDAVGTFDSSGAFLETKVSENISTEEIYASDEADEGTSKEDSPEAKKEASKKSPPKKSSSSSKQSANKKNSKSSSEIKNTEGTPAKSVPEPPKTNSKNSSSKIQAGKNKETVIKTNSTVEKQHQVKKEPDLVPAAQNEAVKASKIGSVILDNVRNSEKLVKTPGNALEEDAFAYHEKATENMVAQWTKEIEQRVQPQTTEEHPAQEKDTKWFYQDPQGETQGPFTSPEMLDWFSAGYFTMGLMVRRTCDEKFSQLGDLIKSWGQVPFMPGSIPPPSQVKPVTPVAPQPIVPETLLAAAAPLSKGEQLLVLQQQMFQQQQLMQRQIMLRQAQIQQQFLSQLKQQDNFTNLNTQQQQVLMQQYLAQMTRPDPNPVPGQSCILEPVPPLSLPILGLPLPSMMKNDLSMWPTVPDASMWSANLPTQPPGGSIWDTDVAKPTAEEVELERQKKLAEEQERIKKAEELRLQQEKELEEKRKQEELRQKQEEEERKRLEELKQQEEERKQQEEIRRLEEQRRKEEEQKRQEELKRQEQLRKAEEKRLQEIKKKEEQARQEELRKQQELRKQEEKKKKEELKRIQLEKEQEKLQEIEAQKEALRRKELEREERLQKEKWEREEADLKKLAELKLSSQGPVWGIQNTQSNLQLSLTDIQRLQEEKERQEKEEKLRQQILQQQVVKQVQQNKNGLTWAKRAHDCQPAVKSLSEIQLEEARQLAQQNRMQKPQAPPPASNYSAGVWGNSSQLNKITAAPASWNTNNVSTGGFWEEALHTTQSKKQPPKANNTESAFPALAIPAQPTAVSSHKSKNNRARKEEDAIARLFGSHHKPTDEFTKWCTDAISAMPSSVDVPTFVAFLKDIESPYEVYDYVKSYFGEGKEPKEFSKQFLEKRSKYRNQAKQVLEEDNSLWGPAPAITPTKNKTAVPINNENDGNSNTKGKTKRRKGKMQKVDSSLLGFTVQPNPDRLNAAGEIERIENM